MKNSGSSGSANLKTVVALVTLLANVGYVLGNPWDLGNGLTYRLNVTQDVTLERASTNFNYLEWLIVGKIPQYVKKRSLLQFQDLPEECTPENIKWAKMYVYYVYSHKASWHSDSYSPFIPRPIEVYMVKHPWDEAVVTSTINPQCPNGEWLVPWLGLSGLDAYPNILDTVTIYTKRPAGWVEWDVTQAVKDWRSGTVDNNGVLLRATNEDVLGRGTRFFSNAYEDPSKHAFINVLCGECGNSVQPTPRTDQGISYGDFQQEP